jgi:hypothetical protein
MFDFQDKLKINSQSIIHGLIIAILILNFANVHADSLKLKETQTDKLKCKTYKEETGQKYKDCDQLTTGKLSVKLNISAASFAQNGIVFSNINNAETPFKINIGSFNFTGKLADADKRKLKSTSLDGTWNRIHKACVYNIINEVDDCKFVKHGAVNIKASAKGATIKISSKRAVNEEDDYGEQAFLALCGNETDRSTKPALASITIGDAPAIERNINVNCKVNRTQKAPAPLEPFDLVNVSVNAKFVPVAP